MNTGVCMVLTVLLGATALSGCARDYYGHPPAAWRELAPSQREAVIREYQDILEAQRAYEYEARFIDPIKAGIIERATGTSRP